MITLAQWLAIPSGLWLIGIGVFMAVLPHHALRGLAAMGSSRSIHFGEMAIRVCVGGLLAWAAPETPYPAALTTVGAFLIISALVIAILPRRWHAAYSTWWAGRISPTTVRLIGPVSIAAGGLLLWALTSAGFT